MAEQTTTQDGAARRQLVGKGSIYTLATAVQMLGVLVVLPVLSRLLSRVEYGQVALATVITSTLGLVAALGLHAVITREYFAGGDGPRAARRLVAITVVVSVAIGGIGLATGPLWGAALGGFTTALALGAVTSIAWAWITAGQAMLRATHSAGRFVTVAVVNVLGGQLLGLAAVLWVSASATSYLAGVASGAFAAALLSLAWARPVWSGLADRAALRGWFAIALPTVPHSAALFLMSVGDRFVIQIQEGDSAVAAYSLAYQMGSLGIILIAAANNAWAPLIYGAAEERRWSILATTTKDMVSLSALLAAGLAFAAPLGLWLLADPNKYDIDELVPVVAITAIAAVPYTLYLASAHVLFWTGKTHALLWITPLTMVLNVGIKALVLPVWGFTGLAVVTVLTYTLLSMLLANVRRTLASVPWVGRAVAFAGACGAGIVGAVIPLGPFGHVARGILVLIVGAMMLFVVRELLADRRAAS